MLKVHTNAKRIAKRLALMSGVAAIGVLGAGATAMANDVTAPAQKVHSLTQAKIEWSQTLDGGQAIGRFQLQESKNDSGVWNNVPLAVPNALSAVVPVNDAMSHQFRIRAWKCPTSASCDWTQATVAGSYRYGVRFQQRVVETTRGSAPSVATSPDAWAVVQSPSFSDGGTLQEIANAPFYATIGSPLGAYNIAPVGTRGPSMGRTTYTYTWKNTAGQSFAATHPPVTQTASTVSHRRLLDERRFLQGSGTLGSAITVKSYDGGTTDIDAVVLLEVPYS